MLLFFFFNLLVFEVDTFSWKKGVSCKIQIFANIALTIHQNFMKFHGYIVY